jgi:hypothetical protein
MPAKSKAQFRLMKAIQGGYFESPSLSKKEAGEFVENQSPSTPPERAAAKKAALRKLRGKKYE